MINKKSQSAIEFLFLIGIILFFFTVFFLIIQKNMSDRIRERKTVVVRETALDVQNEISLAHKSIDGYSRTFKVPEKLNGMEYEINITENMVYVRIKDTREAIALPVFNTTGNLVKGNNEIKKENGKILLNQ
ncbi:hypothetical protein GF386_00350 [Candidatus Pacearchaeota archaeon]|nr:hypothetical protein [Candidatus Pacearchaeota archaeon]MBD3282733.1 hypothetical protein [Candidatus Pacearchaeota archaeon]